VNKFENGRVEWKRMRMETGRRKGRKEWNARKANGSERGGKVKKVGLSGGR